MSLTDDRHKSRSVPIYRAAPIRVSPMMASPTDVDFADHVVLLNAAAEKGAPPRAEEQTLSRRLA
jgi:hypothetical protein